MNEQRPQYQYGTEKNVLSPINLLVDSVELELSFSFADMFEIHFFFFFPNTCSKIADMAGPDRSEGLC